MSPEERTTIADSQSVNAPRRGRPPVPRDQVLRAAEILFAGSAAPGSVSMDDVAAAAGVGKGTLFRAFGSRDGLLDALFAAQLDPWRAELERAGSPIGPDVPAADRVVAIVELLLDFKLRNPRLTAARELSGSDLLHAPHYQWVHGLLRDLIRESGSAPGTADYAAHVLLGALRTDLLTELLGSGSTVEDVRRDVLHVARRILTAPAS